MLLAALAAVFLAFAPSITSASFNAAMNSIIPASSNSIANGIMTNLTIYGLPAGSHFLYRMAPNYTTMNYTITGYTTRIPIYISPATDAAYHGSVSWQYQGAGTAAAYGSVIYTMLTNTQGACSTQTLNANGLGNFCSFYTYLNSSLWNANEKAELKASYISLDTAKMVIKSLQNTSASMPYSGSSPAGSIFHSASDQNGSITFLSTSITQATPDCNVNINGVDYSSAGTYNIPEALVNGHLGLTSQTYYWLNGSFSCNNHNPLLLNYSIHFSNGTVSLIGAPTAASLAKSFSYKVPISTGAYLQLDAHGDANYTSLDPNFNPPANIVNWLNISLQNTQTTATSSGLQIMIPFNASQYFSYEASNLMNIEFFYPNGTIATSWLEGNVLNEQQTQSLSSSANIIYWVKLNPSIAASSTASNVIALGFASTSTNLLNNVNDGVAPQLYNTSGAPQTSYGQYDNGKSIFSFYDNFKGTAVNSTVWNQLDGGSYPTNVSNGIHSSIVNYQFGEGTTTFNPQTYWFTLLSKIRTTNGGVIPQISNASTNINGVPLFRAQQGSTNCVIVHSYSPDTSSACLSNSVAFIANYTLYTIWATSSTDYLIANLNQNTQVSVSAAGSQTVGYIYITGNMSVQYIYVSIAPSNNIMPTASFSSVQTPPPPPLTLSISPNPATYGQKITITATCPVSTDTCAIDYPSLGTQIATGTGSITYTYNAFSLAVGSYSSYYANDITTGTNSIGITLTITKATPSITLPNFPANFVYDGNHAIITANIISYNNQLIASDYLNNNLITSFTTSNTFSVAGGAGTYAIVANTLGNGNYIAASVSNTLTISKNSTYPFTLNSCTSGVLPYSCTTTGSITTHNSQLQASLYQNNNFLGSTYNSISTTIANQIGAYTYTFSSLGNTNYTADSITSSTFYKYIPLTFYNITAGNLATHTIAPPATTKDFTYYPYRLNVSAFNGIAYSLTQSYDGGAPVSLSSSVASIGYTPPANQPTGNYLYALTETQGANTMLFNLSLIPANMLDLNSALTFNSYSNGCIQYLPCLASNTVWTAKPTSWSIITASQPLPNQHTNTSAGEQFDSPNLTISLLNSITLTYGQFSPAISFAMNALNNPLVQQSIMQTQFKVTTSNAVVPYTREINNITGYSEATHGKTIENFSIFGSYAINNYTFSNSSTAAGNNIQVYIPSSTYQNPQLTQVPSIIGTDIGVANSVFYDAINTFCPVIINNGQYRNYNIYAVNANGSLYTFTVYKGYSQTLTGTYMEVFGGVAQSSAIAMQSFKINSNPYSAPLENGQPYSFEFFNCTKTIYQTNFSVWGNPVTLYMPQNASVPQYIAAQPIAACGTTAYAGNTLQIICNGTDPTNLTNSWQVKVYNVTTLLSTSLLATQNFSGKSFAYTFRPARNGSEYHVIVLACTAKTCPDYTQTVLSYYNPLKFKVLPSVAANAWIAIFMVLVGIAIGSRSPAMGLLFEAVFIFLLPVLNIAPIPTAITFGAIGLAAVGAFLMAKRYVYGT